MRERGFKQRLLQAGCQERVYKGFGLLHSPVQESRMALAPTLPVSLSLVFVRDFFDYRGFGMLGA